MIYEFRIHSSQALTVLYSHGDTDLRKWDCILEMATAPNMYEYYNIYMDIYDMWPNVT